MLNYVNRAFGVAKPLLISNPPHFIKPYKPG